MASELRLGSPPMGVSIDTRGGKRSLVKEVARLRSASEDSRHSRVEVVGGLSRTLGEIRIADGAIVHMVADLSNCHRDRGRVNVDDPHQGYRDAQERLMRAVNMNYQASAERGQARELQGLLDRGQADREEMQREIDDGIVRRMELERSLAVEVSRRREAEEAVVPLRKSNLDLTGKLQQAEDRDAELELRGAALESLAPYPNRVVELEEQLRALQREVSRLRVGERQAGEKDAELELLRKEVDEERSRASTFADDCIRL
ncbi:uncharacterized protein LOC133737790 [Rosa rugosa]|uniref:uncharacterized protein LOC133737790 n=1 Tax=Rosa rugosa TaxID=74645 RepID=UPI002B402F6D|nr:uncharacterized protein LOC133737790 [Rosa rugosa]